MIEVYARQERKNPQQRAIVNSKDLINRRTSKLISLLIALKKGWNGGPSPDIGVNKFNLTQPIPDEVVGTGDAAVHELSDIVQTLRQIKTQQDSYSASRTQRSEQLKNVQQEPEQAATAPTASPVPEQQIAAAVAEELLKKTASNPFSRVWAHITAYNPFVTENDRGQRLALLRSLARVNGSLKDIEDKVLSMEEGSVFDSIYIAKQLYSDAKSSFFGVFRNNINEMLSSAKKEFDDLENSIEKASKSKVRDGQNQTLVPNDPSKIIMEAVQEAQSIINEPAVTQEPQAKREEQELNKGNTTLPLEKELKTEPKPEDRTTGRRARRKRRIQTAPVPEVPQSDFIDSDLDKQEQERYHKLVEYVYDNTNRLTMECFAVVKLSLPDPWGDKVKTEYRKIYKLAESIVSKIKSVDHFEEEYAIFLKLVGKVKALAYSAEVEKKAQETNPEVVTGSMLNESEINSQADVFSDSQFKAFKDMAEQKISQASDVSRFIKRMITHIMPRRDRSLRLTISRSLRQARQGLQGLMDVLENRHLDFRRLMSNSDLFYDSLINCYEALADLADMYNSTMRMEKSYRKQKNVKMTYDMIPTMDINALRMAMRAMEIDRSNIQKIDELEGLVSEMSNALEKTEDK